MLINNAQWLDSTESSSYFDTPRYASDFALLRRTGGTQYEREKQAARPARAPKLKAKAQVA